MNTVALFLKGLKSEYNKIIFPTWEVILRDAIIVLSCSVVIGFLIFALDSIISFGFGFVLK